MFQQGLLLRSFAVLSLLCLSALMNCPVSAQERITYDAKVTSKSQLTGKEKRAISYAAVRILKHVNQARVDIKYRDDKDALRNTEQAMKLVTIIKAALPEYQVVSSIKAGSVSYTEEEKAKQWLVPIYGELDEMSSVILPIKRAKKESAYRDSPDSTFTGDLSLKYSQVVLDLRDAKYYLEDAETLLRKNQPEEAERALAFVQEGVIFEYDEADLPLLRARSLLMDGARRCSNKDYEGTRKALGKAASALEAYKAKAGEDVSKHAQELADEVKGFAAKLDSNTAGAEDQIFEFWDSLTSRH